MKRRLIVFTEIIAPYRIPVFNALAQHQEIDLQVVFLAETDPAIRQWRIYADEIRFSYDVLPSWRTRFGEHTVLVNQHVSEALQDADPDVILCGGYNYLASWQAQYWARRNEVPFLLWCESTIYDQRDKYALVEALKRRFIEKCDGFVVPGTSSQIYVQETGGAVKHTFIAPNAVDNELFASHAESAQRNASRIRGKLGLPSRYFLFVGRLVRSKGVLDLIDAYGSLPEKLRSEVGLILAGDGPLRAELESRGRLIFPGAVHLPGFVHRDELANYYALADCFVFPTHSDPWGLVINEAMACGLPIICSEVAGCAADLIEANGRIVASEDITQLAYAMQEFAENPSLRQQMSVRSRQMIHDYSPNTCAAGIVEAAFSVQCRDRHKTGQYPTASPQLNAPVK